MSFFTFRAPQTSTVWSSETTVIRKFSVWNIFFNRSPFFAFFEPKTKANTVVSKVKNINEIPKVTYGRFAKFIVGYFVGNVSSHQNARFSFQDFFYFIGN